MLNQNQPKVPKNHLPPLQVPGVGVPEVGSKVKSSLQTLTLLVVVRKLARALTLTTVDRKNRRRNQPENLRLKKPLRMKK